MYDVTVPVLVHGLKSLAAVLKKAKAHCEQRKIDAQALLTFRLFPDMFPLMRQAQLVTDFAKGCGARLSGTPVPSYPDEEKTFSELLARIAKTVDFLQSLDRSKFNGADNREVTLKLAGQDTTLSGLNYYHRVVLPNFYFHMTTAYNILRHNGVELGKGDFVGRGL
jgi:uncharacterized protein